MAVPENLHRELRFKDKTARMNRGICGRRLLPITSKESVQQKGKKEGNISSEFRNCLCFDVSR